jgi:hypothetical protein
MTGDCHRCKRRMGNCSSLDQQKQQNSPYDCDEFVKDPDCYWESGWV